MARAVPLLPIVWEFRSSGATYRAMVDASSARRAPTPSGTGRWHVKTLQRLVERAHVINHLVERSAAILHAARASRTALAETRTQTRTLLRQAAELQHEMRGAVPSW
jgi:exonuclease VII large subunit